MRIARGCVLPLAAVRAAMPDLGQTPLETGKLASNRAKLAADGVFVVHDPTALLAATPAHKLPGLGTKADALRQLGVGSAADLQAHGAEALINALGLTAAAAEAALTRARGADDTAVKEVVPATVL